MANGRQPQTQEEMIREIWQALYGVPNTEDKGMYGDFQKICGKVNTNAKRITKVEVAFVALVGLLGGLGILSAAEIIQLF